MIRGFRYPLHPTKDQEATLLGWVEKCRWVYNAALEQRIAAYRRQGRSVSRFDQQHDLAELRGAYPEFSSAPSAVLRSALHRIERAYQAFFRRVKASEKPGFPRFRGANRYDSFSTNAPCRIEGNRVHLPKMEPVRFHRYRDPKGVLKDVSVKRDATGRWWLTLHCDLGEAPLKIAPVKFVGIDVGLESLAVTSDGEVVQNPRHYRKAEEQLAARQRKLETKRRGSKRRERQRRLVAKAHLKVRNQRLDAARKVAKSLYERYDAVAAEKLNIVGLLRSRLSKSIHDAGWGILQHVLACKAESAGKHYVEVDPRYTSQLCSACGRIEKKELGERRHCCPCGFSASRDHNAALNILMRGRQILLGLPAPGGGAGFQAARAA